MTRLSNKQNGFTFYELGIVLVAIGILAAIVISTYSGIQAKSRNAKRQTDIQSIQTQLEGFYSQNGYYPSLTDLNNKTWLASHLPKLSPSDMLDPSSSETTSNVQLAAAPEVKVYSYQVTDSNGNACESDDTNCAKYTLTSTFEGSVNGSKTYAKQNLD
ncbi:MAG TPA: prepilin-type N-terminal cleavage/methylation domain-containing protein [Candidatus Saccharimonadales bacterium]